MDYTPLAALSGIITPLIAAVINQPWMSPGTKRAISILTAAVLTLAGLLLWVRPETYQQAAAAVGVAVGAMQVVFTAMQQAGILKPLERITSPRSVPRHVKLSEDGETLTPL